DRQGNSPLHLAARAGHLDLVVFYLWLGLDPNKAGQNLWTPLHEAMSWGHHNVTRQLITHGALLSAANVHGHTPLQLALLFGH
ncbi:ankyrin repeat protein, partial [Dimargaris cristalligena]